MSGGENPRAPSGKPLAKVFTVTRDEYDLIEDFVAHHGRLFGFENVVLLDHGSVHPRVLAAYEGFRARGVQIVDVASFVGNDQGRNFTQVMSAHKHSAEFLIGLDTDEFFYSAAARAAGGDPVDPAAVAATLRALPADATLFEIAEYPCSKPDPASPAYQGGRVGRPAVDITTFVVNDRFWLRKVFFRGEAFAETENGNHNGAVAYGKRAVAPVGYLHFNDTGSIRSFERARKVMDGYKYFDVAQPAAALVTATAGLRVPFGQHRFAEFRRGILRAYIFDLFVELVRRLPSEYELQHHVNAQCNSGAAEIRALFEGCPEALEARPPVVITDDARTKAVFPDPPLGGAELRYAFLSCSLAPPPKKVALVFSGHVRTFVARRAEWRDVLARLADAGLEVDVFFHTWNANSRVGRLGGIRQEAAYEPHALEGLAEVVDALAPKAFKVEESVPSRLPAPARVALISWQAPKANIASQLFSIREGFRLVEDHEAKLGFSYDCVARLRFDLDPRTFAAADFALACQPDHADVVFINAPTAHPHPGGGGGCTACDASYRARGGTSTACAGVAGHANDICDYLAIGGRAAMGRYMTASDRLTEWFTPETFNATSAAMRAAGFRVVSCPIAGGPTGDVRCFFDNFAKTERPEFLAFYPERIQRLNLRGFRVVHCSFGAKVES